MAFTYDNSTNRGKVRLLIGDTVSTTAIFDDSEIDVFLTLQSNDVIESAIMALLAVLTNKVLLTKIIKIGDYMTEEFAIKDINTLIGNLKAQSATGIQFANIADSSELLNTIAPLWRDGSETDSFIY